MYATRAARPSVIAALATSSALSSSRRRRLAPSRALNVTTMDRWCRRRCVRPPSGTMDWEQRGRAPGHGSAGAAGRIAPARDRRDWRPSDEELGRHSAPQTTAVRREDSRRRPARRARARRAAPPRRDRARLEPCQRERLVEPQSEHERARRPRPASSGSSSRGGPRRPRAPATYRRARQVPSRSPSSVETAPMPTPR